MARAPAEISDDILRLVTARGLGAVTIARLLGHFGGWSVAARASARELSEVPGIGPRGAAATRRALDDADFAAERARMVEADATLVLRGDEDYPPLLAAIPDPPAALWVRGAFAEADHLSIAVVGARRCTAYGRDQAARFAGLLAECGITIVSGGAVGIDGEAHRASCRVGGRTIAVLGCGLGVCYPPQHADLFERIAACGVLVSEHPMATEPRPGHFPHRNRIISGLCLGVLVIEAARRSGALITARLAAEDHGREVMVLPGRVDSPASSGSLLALREGWAAPVMSHADVLEQLDASGHLVRGAIEAAGAAGVSLLGGSLNETQQAILACLADGDNARRPEDIAIAAKLPLSRVLAELTLMEIRGVVRRTPEGVIDSSAARR